MKKTKFIFAFAVIVFTLSIFTFAKSCTIESASFHVMLNEDGSADITENWVVNYKKGEFSRFYKTIYQGDEDGENGNMFRAYMLLGGAFIMVVLLCWISDKKKKSGGSGSSCSSCSSCSGCGGCGGAD